jgi:allantoinase
MDQDFYPWSPIVARPPLRWPDNARVALAIIVNLERWDWEVPAGTPVAVSPIGGPEGLWSGNQPQFPDIGGYAHGLSRRRIMHIGMSEEEECEYTRASIAAVERATGTRPVGWSGPDFQETPSTLGLLAAEGIRYVCDWGNDEQPYRMTPKTGELYSLGVNAYLDDNYIHLHGRRTTTKSTSCGASGSTVSMPMARRPGD